jgi:hypothetical protein
MKTYCGSNAGSHILPVLWNARESVWVISPWLAKDYVERLASLSQEGIKVRIITSHNDFNVESIEILKASENKNLKFLILDKEKTAFIHAKIYVVDNKYGLSGSANLTFSGLNSNVENLSIAETNEEVQKIRYEFMDLWMTFESESMPNEKLSSGSSHSIRDALPLSINSGNIDQTNIKDKELVYHPYYFFEFSFRASMQGHLFEDSGFVVLDAETRQPANDDLLVQEIKNNPIKDYVLKTEDKYRLTIRPQKIESFREARELVLNYIMAKNTRHYTQDYRSRYRDRTYVRSYDRVFVPYRNSVSFVKSGFVRVPYWYYEIFESDVRHYESIVFGASGRKWSELIYCPGCQKKIWINEAVSCEGCGAKFCHDCINEKGFVFKKKLCGLCLSKS